MPRGTHNAWKAMEERHAAEVKKLQGVYHVARAESYRDQARVASMCAMYVAQERAGVVDQNLLSALQRLEEKMHADAVELRKAQYEYMDGNGLSYSIG